MPTSVNLSLQPFPIQAVTAPGYGAVDMRRATVNNIFQEGVLGQLHFQVTQRAGGAGLAVDVAAGEAAVLGDTITRQGLYYAVQNSAFTGATELTVAVGGAQPRVDQIILEVKDHLYDGSGLNLARVRVIQGAETVGATLDNRLGAAALPASAIRLADVYMPAAAASATTANIRDRRPWARGFVYEALRNSSDVAFPAAGGGLAALDAGNFTRRMELSGAPLRINFAGTVFNTGSAGLLQLRIQDAGPSATVNTESRAQGSGTSTYTPMAAQYSPPAPTPGSHLVAISSAQAAAMASTWQANASMALNLSIQELAGVHADNGST